MCSDDTAGDALAGVIKSICEKSAAARLILDLLEAGNDATTETGKLKAALDRLNLVFGDKYSDIYHLVRAAYSSLLDLRDDLETLRQLAALDHNSTEIFGARTYIANALVPSVGFPNLTVGRETVLTGVLPARLTRSRGRDWSVIGRDVAASKSGTPKPTGSITGSSMTLCPNSKPH